MREYLLIIALAGLGYYAWTLQRDVAGLEKIAETTEGVTRELEKARERIAKLDAELLAAKGAVADARDEAEEAVDNAADEAEKDSKIAALLAQHKEIVAAADRNKERLRQQIADMDDRRSQLSAAKYDFPAFSFKPRTLHNENQQRVAYNRSKDQYLDDINAKLDALADLKRQTYDAFHKAQAELDANAKAIGYQIEALRD